MFSSSNLVRCNAMTGLNWSTPTVVEDEDVVQSSSPLPKEVEMPHDNNGGYNGKYYVFTINNPMQNRLTMDFTESGLGKELVNRCNVSSGIWSYEKGASGTLHLQGYIQLDPKCKWTALKNKLKPLGAWCAPAKGDAAANIDYISHTGKHVNKPGLVQGPWSIGDMTSGKGPGSRSDLDALVTSIKKGDSVK